VSDDNTPAPQSTGNDDAVTAGRGFLLIAGAKVYFIVASALLALGLPRMFGDPGLFGQYRVVNSLISILNMVMIVGTIQAVSKLVSENESRAQSVRSTAIRLQLFIGGTVAGCMALFAQPIATGLFQDAALAPYIRIGSIVTFFYAIYAVFVGLLNGMKRFSVQAGVDILFSTLKVGLIVGLVLAGWGVMGAYTGFAIAATIIAVVGGFVASRNLPPTTDAVTKSDLGTLLAPILLSTLMVNLIIQLDILGLKGMVHTPVLNHFESNEGQQRIGWLLSPLGGLPPEGMAKAFAGEATDRLAGLFGGAKNISLLPYQATFALTFVVFPLVSKATFDNDRERASATIGQALRFALIVAGLLCVTLSAVGGPMLNILLGPGYGASAGALNVLLVATVMLALLVLSVTILNSARKERTALVLTAVTAAVIAGVLFTLLSAPDDLREGILMSAAVSTLAGATFGLIAIQIVLARNFSAHIPLDSLARVVLVGTVLAYAASMWPVQSFVMMVAKAVVVAVLFLVGLFVAREVKDSDISAIGRIVGRKS